MVKKEGPDRSADKMLLGWGGGCLLTFRNYFVTKWEVKLKKCPWWTPLAVLLVSEV